MQSPTCRRTPATPKRSLSRRSRVFAFVPRIFHEAVVAPIVKGGGPNASTRMRIESPRSPQPQRSGSLCGTSWFRWCSLVFVSNAVSFRQVKVTPEVSCCSGSKPMDCSAIVFSSLPRAPVGM